MKQDHSDDVGGFHGLIIAAMIVATIALGTLAAPSTAQAQACCAATGAGEFAVVGRCQKAVLAAQLSVQRPNASYTSDGTYRSLKRAEVDDFILSVGGGFRPFHPMWQIYGSVPIHLQYREIDSANSDLGTGLGDASLGLRWTALEDQMEGLSWSKAKTFIPFVDVYLSVQAPSGRSPDQSEMHTDADVTGSGFWQASGGIKVTKFVTPVHAISLNASYAYPFAHDVERPNGGHSEFARGNALNLTLSYVNVHNIFWSWGLASSFKMEDEASSDGVRIAQSNTRRLRFGAHVTHAFVFPFWEATLSVMMDSWWEGGAKNVPYVGPTASLGIRRDFL